MLKTYQTPNLVKEFSSKIQITQDTSSAENAQYLIKNLENRSSGNSLWAIDYYDSSNNAVLLTERTCYWATYETISQSGNKMVLGFDFTESVFMHAILLVQDFLDGATQEHQEKDDLK